MVEAVCPRANTRESIGPIADAQRARPAAKAADAALRTVTGHEVSP